MFAVITGANTGMGLEISRALAGAGYDILMGCYDMSKAENAVKLISSECPDVKVEARKLDLADLGAVREFADSILEDGRRIDLLMNNAGSLQDRRRKTVDGLEYNMSVNYVGPFLLTTKLIPLMGRGSRIVNMASLVYKFGFLRFPEDEKSTPEFLTEGCRGSYNRFVVYSNTKLCMLLFSLKLSQLLRDKGITVNATDPWIVSTGIIRMNNRLVDYLCDKLFRPVIFTPLQGAAPSIKLLLDPAMEGVSGKFYKKCWPLSVYSLFGSRSHGVPAIEGVSGVRENKLGNRYLKHKYMDRLWDSTERLLERL